jgi:hypothetical protein
MTILAKLEGLDSAHNPVMEPPIEWFQKIAWKL